MERAVRQNLIFGKDYVFTYGSLGLFYTRSATGISSFQLLFFDLFVVANLIFILHYALQKNLQYLGASALLLAGSGYFECFTF